MPPLPPMPPSAPPPAGPPPVTRAARRPSVERITLVAAVVVLGAAGWLLLKPASSSANAVRPQATPTATAVSSTAAAATSAALTVTPTATPLRTAGGAARTGEAPTKAAYLKAGNAVCVALHKNFDKLGPAPEGKPAAAYITKLVRLAEGAQVRLRALRAPARDAAQLRKIRTRFNHLMALDRQLATALAHDDEQQLISLSPRVNAATAQVAAAYRAEGLTACG